MVFHIITIFPDIFGSYFSGSIIGRAREDGLIDTNIYDLRGWTSDRHRTVDDAPYGGGPGMVMKVGPLYRALRDIRAKIKPARKTRAILLSAKGGTWKQSVAREYAGFDDIIMICGRYEGVDERVTAFVDEEVSIGEYVLTGGEIPAMAVVDSVTRLLPGVLGNADSAADESHAEPGRLEYPQYTRPETFVDDDGREHPVPGVLLSGNHAAIDGWRKKMLGKKSSRV